MTFSTRKFPRAKPHKLSPLEIKALVRHRDGYRCQGCGMTAREHVDLHKRTLDVHRVVPGSRYTVKGCITLCRKCHGPKPKTRQGSQGIRGVTVRGELADVLRAYRLTLKPRPSLTTLVNFIIERFLEARGFWPPPPKDAD